MHDDIPNEPRGSAPKVPKAPLSPFNKPTLTSVIIKAVCNPSPKQCGWAAAITHGISDDIMSSSEVMFDRCEADSAYDAEILGCIAALVYLRQSNRTDHRDIRMFTSKGRAFDLSEMRENGGVPPGKPAFHEMFSDLYRLAVELDVSIEAIPDDDPIKLLADHAADAARIVVGLPPKQPDKPAGTKKCRTPGCDAECKARIRANGEIFGYCWKCKKQWIDKGDGSDGNPLSPH